MGRVVGIALLSTFLAGLHSGCSTPTTPERIAKIPVDVFKISDPLPIKEPPSATGNPESYEVFGRRYYILASSEGYRQTGVASWYGTDFHGKKTSSGPPFDMYAVTAAHKHLPIPTYARVTHLGNGRSIVVRINDRGPFVDDRVIDLSYAAAAKLDMVEEGTAPVEVIALPPYQYLAGFSPGRSSKRAIALDRKVNRVPPATQLASASTKAAPMAMNTAYRPSQWAPAAPSAKPAAQPAYSAPTMIDAVYRPSQPLPALSSRMDSGSLLYLQVGAFSESSRAKQLQRKLVSHFSQAIRIDSSSTLHKVRIGPLNDSAEAQQLVAKLASLGIKAHPVVFN